MCMCVMGGRVGNISSSVEQSTESCALMPCSLVGPPLGACHTPLVTRYPLSEVQRINNLVAERHVQAACQRAEDELEKLKKVQRLDQLDPSLLRQATPILLC